MNIEELEEALDELFSTGFSIETNSRGEVIIYTGLKQDEDGELFPLETEDDEDADFDPDTDPLEDDDPDEE